MLWVIFVWVVFLVWLLIKKQLSPFLTAVKNGDKKILVFSALFFLSGLISLFVKGVDREKLGQFIVLFLQPISIFFIIGYIFKQNPKAKSMLLTTCYLLLAAAGFYAILQYFTLLGLPAAWWGNSVEPKRALSFFEHPNYYALWCAPLLALLLPDLGLKIKDFRKNWIAISAWTLGAIGLLFSFSRAGWLGLGIAGIVYLIFAADKKIKKIAAGAAIVIAIVIISVPNLYWRFALPFHGEKSTVSRASIWTTGWKGIQESPITGLGLTGFSRNWQRLNTDPGLTETHNFPHNIFLDFWVETGILGLISFIGLAWIFIYSGIKNRRDIFKLSVALFLIALISQGQIDNPYFKNDLAMVFWMVLALAI